MGLKGSVFSRRGKCMEVIQEVKLLMRREETNRGVEFLQRQKEMEPRESEAFDWYRENRSWVRGPRGCGCGGRNKRRFLTRGFWLQIRRATAMHQERRGWDTEGRREYMEQPLAKWKRQPTQETC